MQSLVEVECQILKLAETPVANPARGVPMQLVFLRMLIPETSDAELIKAMKRLFANDFLGLCIWDEALLCDRDMKASGDDDEQFFYGADGFYLKPTPAGSLYLKKVELLANPTNRLSF
jgi:hypothetical protein